MTWSGDVTLAVEFGYGSGPLAASPSWVDEAADVRSLTIDRGRSSVRSTFSAGTVSIVMDNLDGEHDPNNTQATNQLSLGVPVRIQATYDAVTYDLFRGHVSRVPVSYPMSGKDAVVHVEATENLGLLQTTRLMEQSYSEESSDTRIDNILDDVSWPAGARDLDSGVASVAALVFTGEAGTLVDQAVEAEQGQFFIAKDGDATFLNRTVLALATSEATFGPSNLDYRNVILAYDDDLLVNLAEITGSDEIPISASDATSVSDYGESSYASTNESVLGQASSLNVAEWIVGKHKDVAVRIVGLEISPQFDPADLWPEVLDRELQDVITVNVNPPGSGDSLSQAVAVEAIHHDITPDFWTVSYSCHPLSALELLEFWVLGTSELDTETRLA